MGDWRRVRIVGTCDPLHVRALRSELAGGFDSPTWGPLHNGGIAGLPNWAAETIDAVGNLGERGYSPQDVADEVNRLIDDVAPGLIVRIDYGAEYESDTCEASIIVGEDRRASVVAPLADTIPPIDEGQMTANLMAQLRGA